MHNRKKTAAFLLVIACMLLCAMPRAKDTHQGQREYGDWATDGGSIISEEAISTMRVCDTTLQSALEISFFPGGECLIYISIDFDTLKNFPNVYTFFGKTVSGSISVGNENMPDVRFKYEKYTDNYWLYIILNKEFYELLLQKAYNISPDGEINIKVEGMENMFEYSLFGFDEALDSCLALVKAQK